MPLLPWKNTRASRISQIVADLQSPQRAGSLVVETGFPTSIVDLFVKHRDRFRKHSARRRLKKKRSKNEFHESTAQLSCSTTLRSHPPEIISTGSAGGCVRRGDLEIEDLKALDEARVVGGGCDLVRNRTETCVVGGGAAGGNGVCLAVLKMFVVSVLALSTKKLVVGITLSAFLLLLLEFVGKRSVCFLKPCAHGEAALRSLIHRVSKHLWIGKDDLVIQDSRNNEREPVPKVSLDSSLNESIVSPELSSSIEEIQPVEPEVDAGDTPQGIEDEKHHLSFLEDEKEKKDGASRHGIRRKRKRRMFEKLVRKKSGTQAIEKKNNREDLEIKSDRFDKVSIEGLGNEEDGKNLEQEQEQDRSILCEEEQDSEKPLGVDEQWKPMEVAESCEIQRIKREGTLSYPILILIVLSGLIEGRFLAVVLTTACCFIIKLNEIARRQSQNPPLKVSC